MSFRNLLLNSIVVLPLLGLATQAADKPNFVVINIDDLGYADIGPFGSTTNSTPNLDRMATEGRKLTSHYAAPVCSPSRSSLMTGCYAKRVLPITHVLFPAAAVGLHPKEFTIAEMLKEVGYETACIGKWHLGDQPDFLPTRQGFDYYFGIPYSNDMGTVEDGSKSNAGQPIPERRANAKAKAQDQPDDGLGLRGSNQPPLPLLENEKVVGRVRATEQFAITRQYTEKAVKFIRDAQVKPFFLYLPHTAVHFPLYPSDAFRGKSNRSLLGDWVAEVDWSVGQILDVLRELKLDQNTCVIFTSDNGGPLAHGANNSPLRGGKGQTLEGGIRVCTIAWWPGKIPADTSTEAMSSMMDLLPTFTKLAGGKLLTDRKIDGVDLWPILVDNPASQPPREQFFYYRGQKLEAVRAGPWKLHLALGELYNLAEDIGESKNIASAHADVVKRLRELAQSMDSDLGLDGVGPGCRQLGKVDNPLPLLDLDGNVRPGFAGATARFD